MDLAANPKVAIKSGQGVGKTSMEAVALLWFLTCFPYPRVVATAPTKQLHDVLWSEVAKWQERSPLLKHILKWTKTYIYIILILWNRDKYKNSKLEYHSTSCNL